MNKFSIKADDYGYLTITTNLVYSSDNALLCENNQRCLKPEFIMRDLFFACNCKKNKDGTRNLILNGNDLHLKIGRRFKNWDVPYLAIFLAKNTDVIKLNLANNEIDSAGFINLTDYMIRHYHILDLDLQNNFLGDTAINYMYNNKEKLKLQVLCLRGNKIGPEKSKKIAMMLANNSSLQRLDVAETDQNEASLIYFTTVLRSDLKFQSSLKILDLSRPTPNCTYAKLDTQHIAEVIGIMLRHNTTLEELHLQKFNFSCHDIEDMFQNANYNKTLKILDLGCNNIGDYGAEIFSKWLKKQPLLQSLSLAHNIISNHGIRALSDAVPFSKLVRINVSHNRFDDYGCVNFFRSIVMLPLIEQIQIYGNNIGSLAAKAIEMMLLSNVLKQENIDVKLYTVDETSQLAYHEI